MSEEESRSASKRMWKITSGVFHCYILFKNSAKKAIIIINNLLTSSIQSLQGNLSPRRGQYIKAGVWDFPVMTERTRLISYLLYGLFSVKKNTIKTPEVIFLIRLRALRLSSSLILRKYLNASHSFGYWKYSCTLSIFPVVFAHAHVVLLTTQKSRRAEKKFHNARSLLSSY